MGWNSWLKPENLVSIINEFYQGYCELMSCEVEKKKRGRKNFQRALRIKERKKDNKPSIDTVV